MKGPGFFGQSPRLDSATRRVLSCLVLIAFLLPTGAVHAGSNSATKNISVTSEALLLQAETALVPFAAPTTTLNTNAGARTNFSATQAQFEFGPCE